MTTAIGNSVPPPTHPTSALTRMGVTPVNSLEKHDIHVSEHNSISLHQPQVRAASVTDSKTPNILTRGSHLNIKV